MRRHLLVMVVHREFQEDAGAGLGQVGSHAGQRDVLLQHRRVHEAGGVPDAADVVVVRSATLFRAGFAAVMPGEPLFLDLPGPSTPRFSQLDYVRAPRPLYPLEDL